MIGLHVTPKIVGNLVINGGNVTNLSALANLTEVTGHVTILSTGLPNLTGLNNLTTIGGNLAIRLNNNGAKLTSLNGLQGLTTVGGNLQVRQNNSLTDCCQIELLLINNGVSGTITINNNLTPCNTVPQILFACPNFDGGGGNNLVVTPPCPGCPASGELSDYEVLLFPNPTSRTLTLRFMGTIPENGTVHISDVFGKLLQTESLQPGERTHQFSVSSLAAGMYFVRVTDGGVPIWSEKVVKQ